MTERHHCGVHNLLHDGAECPKCKGEPVTRLELLEEVNNLNMREREPGIRYWTCTVLYNTVIWRGSSAGEDATMHRVIQGIPQ